MSHSISRRGFLAASAGMAAAATSTPRNLLFIIADQHSGLALPWAGDPHIRVPHLERLARGGVAFTNTSTAGMTCSPSRASLDTGMHAGSHGVRTNGVPLPSELPSIHRVLEQNGYVVSRDPKGYADWIKALGYQDVASPIIGARGLARLIPTPYRFETGRAGLAPEHTYDSYVTGAALKFLEEHRERRFCCWVRLHGPHDPYVAPRPFDTMYDPARLPMPPYRAGEYDEKPARQKRAWRDWQHADELTDDQIKTILAHYYGMISHTDTHVGRLLDRLHDLGLDENTVVLYTADHGDCMGRHRMFTKGFCFYEPAVRIPLVMRAPGLPGGKLVHQPASGVDVLPTVLESMGLPALPDLHGESLVPHWRGNLPVTDRTIFGGQGYEGLDRAVMLRTRRWKLARYDEGGWELYDRENDPDELRSVHGDPDYRAEFDRLKAQLEAWDQAHVHREPHGGPRSEPGQLQRQREAFDKWRRTLG